MHRSIAGGLVGSRIFSRISTFLASVNTFLFLLAHVGAMVYTTNTIHETSKACTDYGTTTKASFSAMAIFEHMNRGRLAGASVVHCG